MPGDLAGFQQMLNGYVRDLGEIQVWMSDPGPFRAGIAWILFCGNYRCVCVCVCVCACACACACLCVCGLCVCFPGGSSGKEPAYQCRRPKRCGFAPWVRKIPWRRSWQLTYSNIPGESHGQRTLVATVYRAVKSWAQTKAT